MTVPDTLNHRQQSLQLDTLDIGHCDDMMALECRAHSHPWSESSMRGALQRHSVTGLWERERLLGFAIFSRVLDEAELLDFVIDPDCQGQGYGGVFLQTLVDAMVGQVRRIYLEVRQSNLAAIAVYQAVGFVEVGLRANYYPSGGGGREDAVLMAMELLD